MANVAIDRLTSVIKFSMSRLQVVTHNGCVMAILFNVRTAPKRTVALGELKNNCKTKCHSPSSSSVSVSRARPPRAPTYQRWLE